MSEGIAFVVYGDDYDKTGSVCARISRQNTDLPFLVLADHPRTTRWEGIKGVIWRKVSYAHNRSAKILGVYTETPFDRTVYLDCDSVIQKRGIGCAFRMLRNSDVVLYPCYKWNKNSEILRIYKRAMEMFGVCTPVTVWQGGIFGFVKNDRVKAFLYDWHMRWDIFGRQREMPCLMAAAYHNSDRLGIGELSENIFAYECGLSDEYVVQHYTGGDFVAKFNVPRLNKKAPKGNVDDFDWIAQ